MTRASDVAGILSPSSRVKATQGGVPDPNNPLTPDSEGEVLSLRRSGGLLVPVWEPSSGGGGGGTVDYTLRESPADAVDTQVEQDAWRNFIGGTLGFPVNAGKDSDLRVALAVKPTSLTASAVNADVDSEIRRVALASLSGTMSQTNAVPVGINVNRVTGAISLVYNTTLSYSAVWVQSNSTAKNAWTNRVNNDPNFSDIRLIVSLTNGATFQTTSADSIRVGSTVFTGPFPAIDGTSGGAANPIIFAAASLSRDTQLGGASIIGSLTTSAGAQSIGTPPLSLTTNTAMAFDITSVQGSNSPGTTPFYTATSSNLNWSYNIGANSSVILSSTSAYFYATINGVQSPPVALQVPSGQAGFAPNTTYTYASSLPLGPNFSYAISVRAMGNGAFGWGVNTDSEYAVMRQPSYLNPWFFGTAQTAPTSLTDLLGIDVMHTTQPISLLQQVSYSNPAPGSRVYLAVVNTVTLQRVDTVFGQLLPTPAPIPGGSIIIPGGVGPTQTYNVYDFGGATSQGTFTLTFTGTP